MSTADPAGAARASTEDAKYWKRQLARQSATLITEPRQSSNPLTLPMVPLIKRTMSAVDRVRKFTRNGINMFTVGCTHVASWFACTGPGFRPIPGCPLHCLLFCAACLPRLTSVLLGLSSHYIQHFVVCRSVRHVASPQFYHGRRMRLSHKSQQPRPASPRPPLRCHFPLYICPI